MFLFFIILHELRNEIKRYKELLFALLCFFLRLTIVWYSGKLVGEDGTGGGRCGSGNYITVVTDAAHLKRGNQLAADCTAGTSRSHAIRRL